MGTVMMVSRCLEWDVNAGVNSYPKNESVKSTDILTYDTWYLINRGEFINTHIDGFLSDRVRTLNDEVSIDVSLINKLGGTTVAWLTIPYSNGASNSGTLVINGQTYEFSKYSNTVCYVHFKFSNENSDTSTLTLREIHAADIYHKCYWKNTSPTSINFNNTLRISGTNAIIDKPIIQATDNWYIIDHWWEDGIPLGMKLNYHDEGTKIYQTISCEMLNRYGLESNFINNGKDDIYNIAQPSMNYLTPRYIFPRSAPNSINNPSLDYAFDQSRNLSMFGGTSGNSYNIDGNNDFITINSFYNSFDGTNSIKLFKNGLIPFISKWDKFNEGAQSGIGIFTKRTIEWNEGFTSSIPLLVPGLYKLYYHTGSSTWYIRNPNGREEPLTNLSLLKRKSVLVLMIGGGGSGKVGMAYNTYVTNGYGGGSGATALCYARLFKLDGNPLYYEFTVGAGGSSRYGHDIDGYNGEASSIGVKYTNTGSIVNYISAQGGCGGSHDAKYYAEVDSSRAGIHLKAIRTYYGAYMGQSMSAKSIEVPLIRYTIKLPGGSSGSNDTGHDGIYYDYAYGGAGSPFGRGGHGHRRTNGENAPSIGAGGGSGTADQNGVFGIGDYDVSSGAGGNGGVWIFY